MANRGPIIAVGVVAIVLLGAPFAIGMINENAMHRELEAASGRTPFATQIESYERGWFSSRVRLQIGLDPEYLGSVQDANADPAVATMIGQFTLPVIVEIGHGPILLDDGFGLGTASVHAFVDPASQIAILAQQFLGLPYVFDFRGRGGFASGFHYEGDVPPVDLSLPDVSVMSSGIVFSGTRSGGESTLHAELANLSLQSMFASAIVESLVVTSDMTQREPDSMPLGTGAFSVGRVSFSDPLQGTTSAFSLEDAGVDATVAANDAATHVDMRLLYRIGRASVSDELDFSDVALGVNLNHIDIDAANDFYRITNDVDRMTDPEAMLAELMPIVDRIVADEPSLTIDPLELSMSEGSLSGRLTVTLDPGALPTGRLSDLQDLGTAMAALGADLEVTASKPLAERLAALVVESRLGLMPGPNGEPMSPEEIETMAAAQAGIMLIALTAQGILVDEGDSYRASIQFTNGQPTANGQPLSLGF